MWVVMNLQWLYSLQLVTAVSMSAAVWFVQFVHYPLYRSIPQEAFGEYHRGHLIRARLTLIGPILLELFGALGVLWLSAWSLPSIVGLGLLGACLLLTATLIELTYRSLTRERTEEAVRSLLRWNLLRGLLWSGRAGVVLWVSIQ